MKVELISLLCGEMSIELIAETPIEYAVLTNTWRIMEKGDKPYRGNGQTYTDKGSTGFYLPATPREGNR